MNDAAAPDHVCPGIGIHIIDMVQLPGIGISPIADMRAPQAIVIAALAEKTTPEAPRKTRRALTTRSLSARRTGRDASTTRPARCGPWVRDRATDTCPTGYRGRARTRNTCDRPRRPRGRTRSPPGARVCTF